MAFNLALLKEHPYATGAVVIIGGIVAFYLISSGGSGSSSSSSSDNGFGEALAAQAQAQQTNAAAEVQNNQTQAEVQAAQLTAQTTDQQTSAAQETTDTSTIASLINGLYGTQAAVAVNNSNNTAATTQSANQLVYAQNLQSMQDSVLEDNINTSAQEQEYGDDVSLQGLEDNDTYQQNITTLQAGVASQGLTDETGLATQELDTSSSNDAYILSHAGEQENSGLDATDQTALFAAILNPNAAGSVGSASSSVANNATNATASIANTATKAGSSLLSGLFA